MEGSLTKLFAEEVLSSRRHSKHMRLATMRAGFGRASGQRAFRVSGVWRKQIEGVSLMTEVVRGSIRCLIRTMLHAAFMQCRVSVV